MVATEDWTYALNIILGPPEKHWPPRNGSWISLFFLFFLLLLFHYSNTSQRRLEFNRNVKFCKNTSYYLSSHLTEASISFQMSRTLLKGQKSPFSTTDPSAAVSFIIWLNNLKSAFCDFWPVKRRQWRVEKSYFSFWKWLDETKV